MLIRPTRDVRISYRPRRWAARWHASMARFSALVMHRRCGKTTGILHEHQHAALDDDWEMDRLMALEPKLTARQLSPLLKDRFYLHVFPTFKQGKLVALPILRRVCADVPGARLLEGELKVHYQNGATLQIVGSDNPDSLRGPAPSGVSFDEYAQQAPNVFGEVLSKALADHLGYAIFAGTIKGKNHLYRTWDAARHSPHWFALWQPVDVSLATEEDVFITVIEKAMEDDRMLVAQGLMTQAEFDQEWFLSLDAFIKGSYYGDLLAALRKGGRITRVPYNSNYAVDTDWDLGIDRMSIWFSQRVGSEVRLIDYHQNIGGGLPVAVRAVQDKPYTYGTHWGPHDVETRAIVSGKTPKQTAEELGLKLKDTPRLSPEKGIAAAQRFLPICVFDETKCEDGLEALRNYRRRWNSRLKQFEDEAEHDWASHAADAFRGLAVRYKPPSKEKHDERISGEVSLGPDGMPGGWLYGV